MSTVYIVDWLSADIEEFSDDAPRTRMGGAVYQTRAGARSAIVRYCAMIDPESDGKFCKETAEYPEPCYVKDGVQTDFYITEVEVMP